MNKETTIDIDDPRYRITPIQQVLASCTGAILTSLLVTPLDVIKIRLQAQTKLQNSKCFLYCNGLMDHICDCTETSKWYKKTSPTLHFSGTIDAFAKISKHEGISSLWSGLSPTLVLAVPATIIYFVTYEQLRLKLKDKYNSKRVAGESIQQPFWIPMLAGGTARVISVSIVSPLELIRTKMQSTKLTYLEIGQALKMLVRTDGVRGLWKGVVATLLRDVPFSALYWTGYENVKKLMGVTTPSFSTSFIAGAVSGAFAATVTVPFDVVKTHQQIEIGSQVILNEKRAHSSMLTLFRSLYKDHGLRGLFAGLTPRLIKVAPACAIMIATFEHSKLLFNRYKRKSQQEHQHSMTHDQKKQPNLLDINVQQAKPAKDLL